MVPLCGADLPPELAARLFAGNLATGLAYYAIALFIIIAPRGAVRQDYRWGFSVFVWACGSHHLGMALCLPPFWQWLVDTGMAGISSIVAVLMALETARDLLDRLRER